MLDSARQRLPENGMPDRWWAPHSGSDLFLEATMSDTGLALARRFTNVEDVRVGNPKVENPSMTSLSQAFYSSLLSPSNVSVINPA